MHSIHKHSFVLGIYGDGQLARLLAQKAQDDQVRTVVFTLNAKDSPCEGLADELIEASSWSDEAAFERFRSSVTAIVLENEFVPPAFLCKAEGTGVPCYPSAKSYEAVSDKLKQVTLAQKLGVSVPTSTLIERPEQLSEVSAPVMLKAIRGGYDGYGNFLFKDPSQLSAAKEFITKAGPSLAQEVIHFQKEVAVMVVRSPGAKAQAFPVVETIQEDSICHYTLTPARIPDSLTARVQAEARKLIDGLDGVGLFGIEFFLRGDDVIFNEIAPRPHNSAHLTIEACNISQFEALLRLARKEAVPMPTLTIPSAGMLNLLGTRNGPAQFEGEGFGEGQLHLYGKKNSRIGRKMGHFTITGPEASGLLSRMKELKTRYKI